MPSKRKLADFNNDKPHERLGFSSPDGEQGGDSEQVLEGLPVISHYEPLELHRGQSEQNARYSQHQHPSLGAPSTQVGSASKNGASSVKPLKKVKTTHVDVTGLATFSASGETQGGQDTPLEGITRPETPPQPPTRAQDVLSVSAVAFHSQEAFTQASEPSPTGESAETDTFQPPVPNSADAGTDIDDSVPLVQQATSNAEATGQTGATAAGSSRAHPPFPAFSNRFSSSKDARHHLWEIRNQRPHLDAAVDPTIEQTKNDRAKWVNLIFDMITNEDDFNDKVKDGGKNDTYDKYI